MLLVTLPSEINDTDTRVSLQRQPTTINTIHLLTSLVQPDVLSFETLFSVYTWAVPHLTLYTRIYAHGQPVAVW
jgi:hypothetical protein